MPANEIKMMFVTGTESRMNATTTKSLTNVGDKQNCPWHRITRHHHHSHTLLARHPAHLLPAHHCPLLLLLLLLLPPAQPFASSAQAGLYPCLMLNLLARRPVVVAAAAVAQR
jgi:hypothetical protein